MTSMQGTAIKKKENQANETLNSFGFNVKSFGSLLNSENYSSKDLIGKSCNASSSYLSPSGKTNPTSAMSLLSGVKNMIHGPNPNEMSQQSQKQMKSLAGIIQKFR
jgi:hypothetical protein